MARFNAYSADTPTNPDIFLFEESGTGTNKKVAWSALVTTMKTDLALVFDDLGDVSVGSPTTNDVVQWSGAAWAKVTPAVAVATVNLSDLATKNLADLDNVATGAADNDILQYNGSSWSPVTPSEIAETINLSDLADAAKATAVASATAGDVMTKLNSVIANIKTAGLMNA
jgi:hypothetical protein